MDFKGPVAYSSRGAQCHLFKGVVRVHVTHRLPPYSSGSRVSECSGRRRESFLFSLRGSEIT